jgi:Heme exporter protein D (CcmD)
MNHWPFIIAAYAVTLIGTVGVVLWAYQSMRRAEREVEKL